MTLVIVTILLIGYILIATSSFTKVNKAAVAMFAGTVGWVLYICYGADFVMRSHGNEYAEFLGGAVATSTTVKHFIAQSVFIKYVGRGAELVLFLLATMTIVEILDNNGCFDFIKAAMRTHRSRKLLWVTALITFVISANLDNLTTTTMMLVIMRGMIPNRRQRMIYGCAIVLAANCGGALTVIGDPIGLLLWTNGIVSATSFSMTLLVPCLIACALPLLWLQRQLPGRVQLQWTGLPYRGNDTNLNRWQRLVMLFVGIGGLWFIPTFQNITKLSPFLGALCVLSVLWVVNEIMNRRLMDVDKMIHRSTPRVLQHGVIQLMLFVMGIMLAVGAVKETGCTEIFARWCDTNIHSVWLMGIAAGCVSSVLDTFASAATFISTYPAPAEVATTEGYASLFACDGLYWKVIAYCSAMGGNFLMIGSAGGLALMKMEHIHIGWYLRNVGWVAVIASLLGLAVMCVGMNLN